MAKIDSNAKALYRTFNVSQLREVGLAARISADKLTGAKTAVTAALDGISDAKQAAMLAHRVETVSPYKHCVPLENASPILYSEVRKTCENAFPEILSAFRPLDSDDTDLVPQLCIFDDVSQRVFIKFAHLVRVFEFKKTDDGLLKVKVTKRHVMVVVINTSNRSAYIAFPGFTQAVAEKDKEKITYDTFASQIVKIISEKLAISFEGFKLKAASDFLLDDESEHVVDLRRTLRFRRGGKMALDSESDEDAAYALAQGLSNTTGVTISPDAIRAAFRASEAQAIVLLWQKQGLITRLALKNALPELLFIWDQNTPSVSLVEDILARFLRARDFVGSGSLKEAFSYLRGLAVGEVTRPSWLEQHFSISADAALKVLLDACTARTCAPVFRIRPDRAFNLGSTWVRNLELLPAVAQTEEGERLETRDPSNIEIAFERLPHLTTLETVVE